MKTRFESKTQQMDFFALVILGYTNFIELNSFEVNEDGEFEIVEAKNGIEICSDIYLATMYDVIKNILEDGKPVSIEQIRKQLEILIPGPRMKIYNAMINVLINRVDTLKDAAEIIKKFNS